MENAAGVRTKKSEDDKSKHDDRDHSRVDFTEGIAIRARGRLEEKGGTRMGENLARG